MKNIRLSNKKAESLIELVMALFLLSLVLFEASSLLKNFTSFSQRYEKNLESEDDINLFFSFMENDFTLYSKVSVKSDSIHFENKDKSKLKSCDYYLSDSRVKRIAGGQLTGITYFLNDVKDLSFEYKKDDGIIITNIKLNEKEYKKIFSTNDVEVIEWRRAAQV